MESDWEVNKIIDDSSGMWYDYYNSKRDSVEITIQYHNFYKKYIVYIYGGKIPIQKKFDKKEQAISYVKNYTRTH